MIIWTNVQTYNTSGNIYSYYYLQGLELQYFTCRAPVEDNAPFWRATTQVWAYFPSLLYNIYGIIHY